MKVIPIHRGAEEVPALEGCEEESGVVRKVDLPLVRRDFLKGFGILMGSLASGYLVASLATAPAWVWFLYPASADH